MRSRADRTWQELAATLREGRQRISLRPVVLAAHPDDEAIGAFTLLSRCNNPAVMYLTDGAPRDPGLWSPDFQGSRQQYLGLRKREAEQALSIAGVFPGQTHWLEAVDQESIFQAEGLACRVSALLAKLDPDILVTHPYEGGHPDHDTAALVAHLVVERVPAERSPVVVEMTSYHARNGQRVSGEFLDSEPAEVLNVELSTVERARKDAMFAAYASQRRVLQSFNPRRERFRRAPQYDFCRPPHDGKLWYECMGWPLHGEQWRTLAKVKTALQETSCR